MDEIREFAEKLEIAYSDAQDVDMKEPAPNAWGEERLTLVECMKIVDAQVVAGLLCAREQEANFARSPIDYQPEFCELVVELGKQGLSLTEIAVKIEVARATLDRWSEAHDEFEYAMTLAYEAALAYYERKGREGIFMGKNFNGSLWMFLIKMRFPEEYGDASAQVEPSSQRSFQLVISEEDARL